MKFIFLSLFIALGCSKSPQKTSTSDKTDNTNSIVQFEPININTVNGAIPATSLDFASLAHTDRAQQDIIITNTGLSSLSLSEADLNLSQLSPFSIVSNTCNVDLPSRKKCKIVVQISNSSPLTQPQDISSALIIKGSVISLTANLQAVPVVNPSTPIANISVSPTSLNFGVLKNSQFLELSVIVKNNGLTNETIATPIITDSKITISSNTCSSLASRKSCVIKFKYTATLTNAEIVNNEFTKIANTPILHSVLVNNPVEGSSEASVISPLVAPLLSSNNYSVIKPAVQNVSIVFKNNGIVTFPSPVSANITGSGVSISSISCPAGLSRGKTCTVNAQINSALISEGQSQRVLTLRSGTLSSTSFTLNLDILGAGTPVACSLENAAIYGVNLTGVASVSGNTPDCEVASCSVSFVPSDDLKSCTDALVFIGQASQPITNDLFEINNKRIFLTPGEVIYDDLNDSYNVQTAFFEQSGLSLGTEILSVSNFQSAPSFIPKNNILLNDSTIISVGTSYSLSEPQRQFRKTTIAPVVQSSIILEEPFAEGSEIVSLMKYDGASNNDKLLVVSKTAYPHKFNIRVSNAVLTTLGTVMESEDYSAAYDTFALDVLQRLKVSEPTQIGNKLIFSITRVDTNSNQVYELYSYDGVSISLLTSKSFFDEKIANFGFGSEIGSIGNAANSSKYYEMIQRNLSCDQTGYCRVVAYVIETDGTVAGTFDRDTLDASYNQPDGIIPGNELLYNSQNNGYLNIDNRVFGANEYGFFYSFFGLSTIGSFDYINSADTDPCDRQDESFTCENQNYLQQIGKHRVKKLSNTGSVTILQEGITKYGYEYASNTANSQFEFFARIGTFDNEFHILQASNIPSVNWYRTNGSSSLTLIEDLNTSLGLSINDVGGGLPTAYRLSPGEFVLQFNQNNFYKKVGSNPTVTTLTIDSGSGSYFLKGNRLYFESYSFIENEYRTGISSTDGVSIREEYLYPVLQDGYYIMSVFKDDLFVQKYLFSGVLSTDVYILKSPSP